MHMSPHRYPAPVAACALAVLASLASCLRPPEYPLEPVLTFEGISRDSMLQGVGTEDSISVFLSFTDGDGDINPSNAVEMPNVILVNRRSLDTVTTFQLDPIPEEGAENGISGDLRLRVYTTCCDYPPSVPEFPCEPSNNFPVDTLLLEAYMVDRAGNESNRVDVAPIYLICNRF